MHTYFVILGLLVIIYLYFIISLHLCVSVCGKPEDPLRLELKVAVSCMVWLLGTKFWSPGIATSVLNH